MVSEPRRVCVQIAVQQIIINFLENRGKYKLRRKNVLYGEALRRGPTAHPFIHYFWQKKYPFRIPSIDKWYSFHIPIVVYNFAFILTAL